MIVFLAPESRTWKILIKILHSTLDNHSILGSFFLITLVFFLGLWARVESNPFKTFVLPDVLNMSAIVHKFDAVATEAGCRHAPCKVSKFGWAVEQGGGKSWVANVRWAHACSLLVFSLENCASLEKCDARKHPLCKVKSLIGTSHCNGYTVVVCYNKYPCP